MQLPPPSVQEGAGVPESFEQPAPASEPFLDGPDAALWVGFGAFVIIFFLVIMIIVRGRVVSPARRKAMDATFFEPAGEDADISFDDPFEEEIAPPKARKDRKKRRKSEKPKTEAAEEPLDFSGFEPADVTAEGNHGLFKEDIAPTPKKKRSAFAGLFSKQKETGTKNIGALEENAEDDFAKIAIEHAPGAAVTEDDLTARSAREDERRMQLEQEQTKRRMAEEDERAHAAAEERDRIYQEVRDQAEREAEFERRKAEAALEQRMQAVAAMQRKLSEKADTLKSDAEHVQSQLGASLEERFAALSSELSYKLENAAMTIHETPPADTLHQAPREITAELAEFFSREIHGLRTTTEEALDKLSRQIEKLDIAPEGAAELSREIASLNAHLAERSIPGTAGRLQLTDIVRSALPADRYSFSYKLSSGRTADCLVFSTDRTTGPVAIDARYPVEAFDHYLRAGMGASDKTANEYRRALLRHLTSIAEGLIIPGETAPFAVVFTPSETIFNDLHTNFSDVVQDSYRANVWILSPTSLMATLHMMGALACVEPQPAEPAQDQGNQAVLLEIADLRRRIMTLENEVRPDAENDAYPDKPPAPGLFDENPFLQERSEEAGFADQREDPADQSEHANPFDRLHRPEALDAGDDEDNYEPTPVAPRPPFPLR